MPEISLEALFGQAPDVETGNRRFVVTTFPYVVGRSRDCDLCVPNASVSRRHCRLFWRDGGPWVEDLGSMNGTFVNEEPVKAPRPLRDGDVLRLAYVIFLVGAPAPPEDATFVDGEAGRPHGAAGRQVLVVEDDVNAAESLALLLRAWGHNVRVAHDGPEALRSARERPPDAVLLDVRLPGMDGYQVARRLREQSGLEKALVVAMTGCADAVEGDYSHESAIQELLIKPMAPETLRDVIGRA